MIAETPPLLRIVAYPRSFAQLIEDIRCDIATEAPPVWERRIACELALAERSGIRSVWIHGLWVSAPFLDRLRWEAR